MTRPSEDLTGKVAIVTGAAGGIGSETVRVLARSGARVVGASLPGPDLDALSVALRGEGLDADVRPLDIADEASVAALIQHTMSTYGRLDALDNNAVLQGLADDRDVATMSVELWDRVMSVNVRGTMLMCKHAVPAMIKSGGGSIVNISSGTSLAGDMQYTAYATSKGAINTLTRYVATQYGAQGVRCNALALGLVGTPMLAANMPPPLLEIFRSNKLIGRIGRPNDIAEIVAFLVSNRAEFITGQLWSVDGGFYAHVPTTVPIAALLAAHAAQ